jgi:hypothetical protein
MYISLYTGDYFELCVIKIGFEPKAEFLNFIFFGTKYVKLILC